MTPLRILTAGSLAGAIGEIAAAFSQKTGIATALRPGPAGLLAREIFAGDAASVYISASLDGPRALHEAGLFTAPQVFAQNRMVLVLRPGLEGAAEDPLDWLAQPGLRIGMSTPGADPSGDYAAAFLHALASARPELHRALAPRVSSLFGGSLPDPARRGHSPAVEGLRAGLADLLIVYATTARRMIRDVPGARVLPLPENLSPPTQISASRRATLGGDDPAQAFLDALQMPPAQSLLAEAGFLHPQATKTI